MNTDLKTQSMFAKYAWEEEQKYTVECADGFITYKLFPEYSECMICDFYVKPEKRVVSKTAVMLADKVEDIAREKGMKNLSCCVNATEPEHKRATYKTKLYIKYGFDIICVRGDQIVMAKPIV